MTMSKTSLPDGTATSKKTVAFAGRNRFEAPPFDDRLTFCSSRMRSEGPTGIESRGPASAGAVRQKRSMARKAMAQRNRRR
jgi:hypothetical protein